MKTTIILTSTVNVNLNKLCLFQINKSERIEIYLKSVNQWLLKTDFNIILVENSGYLFHELDNEKEIYKNRFEIITFSESDLTEANYLINNISKGVGEIYSIDYAFKHSKLIHSSNFIIKITGRYFIEELEDYLKGFDLDQYDCLTQNNRSRCEMVGSHYKHFSCIFNVDFSNEHHLYYENLEDTWKFRTSNFANNLRCKTFLIEPTQRGGVDDKYDNI